MGDPAARRDGDLDLTESAWEAEGGADVSGRDAKGDSWEENFHSAERLQAGKDCDK